MSYDLLCLEDCKAHANDAAADWMLKHLSPIQVGGSVVELQECDFGCARA